ncbi:telomere-associated protein RIF1-like [Maniola hyperantus]|uniref:telomere-associated protein RIF1-like n=1 Tax=Aphantopus hyperantus TaxID=2795564 RepID=UPI001568C042|nr:telomere-associated protein RIF1 [Maniola hyperantus]
MPEDCTTERELEQVIDDLEDYSLNARNYQTLQETLNSVGHITASTAEKLLLLCFRDRIEDWKYTTHVLNIIKTLLKKIEDGLCTPLPDLVPSALAVLNALNTTVECKYQALQTLCFEILFSYPDEALNRVCISHSREIYKLINLYCHQDCSIPAKTRLQPIHFVAKLLRVLPPNTKETFVKGGINIWFSRVIPLVIEESVSNTSDTVLNLLEALELLTDALVQIDYSKNSSWLQVFVNIHTPTRYPALVTNLLKNRSNYWYRLWIIFIKLLKGQITKCSYSTVSPINTLLPCVEMAFKLDVKNRCRAFLCWNAIIDNFSKEPNEALLDKRLKLLMVPLTANNAKIEETALAKLKTWWYLITCFEAKLDKYLELVVMPFLIFCFGRPGGNVLIPGKICAKTKIESVQAFINIIGHSQCEGCVPLPRLNTKLLNTKLLVNHYRHWIHSISSAIRICVEQNDEFTKEQIKCVWKSFIMTIGELPENNIRRDLFNEALIMLDELTKDCDNRRLEAMVNVLLPTLFDSDEEMQALLKSTDEQNAPVYKIFTILNKLPLDSLQDRVTALESIKRVVEYAFKTSSNPMELWLKTLSPNGMLLWTALAGAVGFRVYSAGLHLLAKMFLWPFNFMNNFAKKEESTSAWLNLYKTLSSYLQMKSINEDIVTALMAYGAKHSSCVFVLNATIAVLENKLLQGDTDFYKELEFILQLTSEVNETQIKLILPTLSDIIVHTLTALIKKTDPSVAETVMIIINNLLKVCKVIFKEKPDNESHLAKYIENIFNSLKSFFMLDLYSGLKIHLADQLKECAPYLKNEKLLKSHILAIYKTSLNKNHTDIAEDVVQAFEIIEVPNSVNLTPKQNDDSKTFPTASGKAAKKSKKVTSITGTVIENGEEFVVVKSNWKFNRRKLTENQKEKLQRKREDIPAMYQDLSQSQDEFKLTTWKTDSQDTSTTSSKSANEDLSVIIKNITYFYPKIIGNVTTIPVIDLTQNTEPFKEKVNINNEKAENDKISNIQSTVRDVKSPRMALKDRVLRNVRNLTERSNLDQECTDVTENSLKTHISSVEPLTNLINPAPSQINPERPSRVKRKPKKFDHVELISLTKKRRSLNTSDSQTEIEITENQIQTKMDKNSKDDKTVENNDKANNVHSQELIDNAIENSAVVKDNIKTVEHHKNDKLVEKVTMTNCFIVTENLNLTNDAVKEWCKKDESKSNALPATMYFKKKETIEGKPCPDKTDNSKVYIPSDKIETVKEKAEEKTGSDDNTVAVSTPKVTDKVIEKQTCSSKNLNTKKSRIESQLAIDMVEGHGRTEKKKAEENPCSDDYTVAVSTPKVTGKVIEKQICSSKNSITKKSRIESQLAIDMVEWHGRTEKKKAEENTGSDDNTVAVSTPKVTDEVIEKQTCSSKNSNTKKSRTESQLAIDMVEWHGRTEKKKAEENTGSDDNSVAVSTPKVTDEVIEKQTCSSKNSHTKKSRIESQLAIDMVEGHGRTEKKKAEEKPCSDDYTVAVSTPKVTDKVIEKQICSSKNSFTKKSRIESQLAIDMVEWHGRTEKKKAEENTGSDDNTVAVSTPKVTDEVIEKQTCSSKNSNTKKSRIEIQMAIDMVEGHGQTEKEKVEENTGSDDNTVAVSTPKVTDKVIEKQTCSSKKSNAKKSRIESQLAIDMVEGHPFLKVQSEKRSTRKAVLNSPLKRKRLSFDPDGNKFRRKGANKAEKKTKQKSISIKDTPNSEDICASQDFIESSQDSAVTTMSVKSSKPIEIKKAVVVLEALIHAEDSTETNTQNLIDDPISVDFTNMESNSDIELPCNKTNVINLTEEMDTEPIDYDAVDVLSENENPILVNYEGVIEPDTQNTADADTDPVDPNMFLETNVKTDTPFDADQKTQITDIPDSNKINDENVEIIIIVENDKTNESLMTTAEDVTKTLSESILIEAEKDDLNTVCNNEQRKKDFLNNTLQISPIKSMSPVRDEKSPSPETSNDYVVINLASPVQSNGQPFEICESPEIFTEDKVSPDKRNQSPPREEVSVKSASPSSSLSLKKNRPQMRSGGRAAQMLGLCVPDRLQTMMTSEKPTDPEEAKRSPSLNTSAKRNLRILYNSSVSNGDNNDTSDDTEDSETFLKFRRTLPTTDCSPSVPILKRKIIHLTDEPTASPPSKRKRVSFHDPPVSTTVCVKKYIEHYIMRSPQNSATKRLERQTRAQTAAKSPRRLENEFKLDSVLTKAVESFSGSGLPETMNEDTEMSSLDETPVVEVIKTSDLNDTDPICKELEDCEDHIDNIAAELSSPAMKELLVKKFEGKVETIGDLAKMTELQVNRLCIKAPKVQVVKTVLNEYLSKLKQASEKITPTVEAAMSESSVLEARKSIEIQTDGTSVESIEAQTDCVSVSLASSQTDAVLMSDSFVQTYESGSKSTADIITDCITERPDFVERLYEISKEKILENLPNDVLIKILMDKSSYGDGKHVLSILQDHLVERFEHKDLILFCSSLLKKVYHA